MVATGADVPRNKRLRVRKACLPCRQRKRKCDSGFPCGMCTSYGYNCQYDDVDGPLSFYEKRPSPKQSTSPSTIQKKEVERPSMLSPCSSERGIFDPSKSRYMSLHSAVAFPRYLGLELQSVNPPHLHSFAWNCGIRPEENSTSHPDLANIISKDDCNRFTDVYFEVVHPMFDIIDPSQFRQSLDSYWGGARNVSAFDAVIGGVVALGSFFSRNFGHARELDIVQYAKDILEDPTFSSQPSIEQISAWVLRSIYLRATARPHVAWLASCMTMHLVEATALHHEVDKVELATRNDAPLPPRANSVCERARRLFWCAWCINTIISYEYGRSCVTLNKISCKLLKESTKNYTAEMVELARMIPTTSQCSDPASQVAALIEAIDRVYKAADVHPFLSLTKADLCHSFYRRLRLLNHVLDRSVVLQIINIGTSALSAAEDLVRKNHTWWNVLSTVFHYFCVLLAIDSPDSLSNVAAAKSIFDSIVKILDTHIAKEAQATAKLLLRDSMKKKKREIAHLEIADKEGPAPNTNYSPDIDWDALLDPSNSLNLMHQEYSIL